MPRNWNSLEKRLMSHLKREECLKEVKKEEKMRMFGAGGRARPPSFVNNTWPLNPPPTRFPFCLFFFSILGLSSFTFFQILLSLLPPLLLSLLLCRPLVLPLHPRIPILRYFILSISSYLCSPFYSLSPFPPSSHSSLPAPPPPLPLNPANTKGLDRSLVNWRLKKYTSPFFLSGLFRTWL